MVEIFKTNVGKAVDSKRLALSLQEKFPGSDIHFDLEDCDKILRVEHPHVASEKIILLLSEAGYMCEVMM